MSGLWLLFGQHATSSLFSYEHDPDPKATEALMSRY